MSATDPFTKLQLEKRKHASRCTFCPQVQVLTKQRRADLKAALENQAITLSVILEVIARWGIIVSKTQMQTHRQGKMCPERFARALAGKP
jgi:hypothetical protein